MPPATIHSRRESEKGETKYYRGGVKNCSGTLGSISKDSISPASWIFPWDVLTVIGRPDKTFNSVLTQFASFRALSLINIIRGRMKRRTRDKAQSIYLVRFRALQTESTSTRESWIARKALSIIWSIGFNQFLVLHKAGFSNLRYVLMDIIIQIVAQNLNLERKRENNYFSKDTLITISLKKYKYFGLIIT